MLTRVSRKGVLDSVERKESWAGMKRLRLLPRAANFKDPEPLRAACNKRKVTLSFEGRAVGNCECREY